MESNSEKSRHAQKRKRRHIIMTKGKRHKSKKYEQYYGEPYHEKNKKEGYNK